MASAGCRYEVVLYIFSFWRLCRQCCYYILCRFQPRGVFLITKLVGFMLLMELTGNTQCDVSNAILYKLCFFSGISDHDSVKLCYSRSQVFSLFVLDVWLQRRSVITVGFMQHWSDLLLSCGPEGIQVFVKPAMKPWPGSLWGENLMF